MAYSFTCYGHENITAKHKTTLEFTKSNELSLKGNCIIGVKADFSIKEIKRFIESLGNNKKIIITIAENKIIEKINAEINSDFNSGIEMVIRKSGFIDERTFAINADKCACDLRGELIKHIAGNKQKIIVAICTAPSRIPCRKRILPVSASQSRIPGIFCALLYLLFL